MAMQHRSTWLITTHHDRDLISSLELESSCRTRGNSLTPFNAHLPDIFIRTSAIITPNFVLAHSGSQCVCVCVCAYFGLGSVEHYSDKQLCAYNSLSNKYSCINKHTQLKTEMSVCMECVQVYKIR